MQDFGLDHCLCAEDEACLGVLEERLQEDREPHPCLSFLFFVCVGGGRVGGGRVERHHCVEDGAEFAERGEARFVEDSRAEGVVERVAEGFEEGAVQPVRIR